MKFNRGNRCRCFWLMLMIFLSSTGLLVGNRVPESEMADQETHHSTFIMHAGGQFSSSTSRKGRPREAANASIASAKVAAMLPALPPRIILPPAASYIVDLPKGRREALGFQHKEAYYGQASRGQAADLFAAPAIGYRIVPSKLDSSSVSPAQAVKEVSNLSLSSDDIFQQALALGSQHGSRGARGAGTLPDGAEFVQLTPPRYVPVASKASVSSKSAIIEVAEDDVLDGLRQRTECDAEGGGCRLGCVCGAFDHCYTRWRPSGKGSKDKVDVGVCELSPLTLFLMSIFSIVAILTAFVLLRFFLEEAYHEDVLPPGGQKHLAAQVSSPVSPVPKASSKTPVEGKTDA